MPINQCVQLCEINLNFLLKIVYSFDCITFVKTRDMCKFESSKNTESKKYTQWKLIPQHPTANLELLIVRDHGCQIIFTWSSQRWQSMKMSYGDHGNWNTKHYKLVEFLSNLNVKPPCTNIKPPYLIDNFLATAMGPSAPLATPIMV